jgi:hypothetical protein
LAVLLSAPREQLADDYSPTTVNYDVSMLYTLFESAIVAELVEGKPARSVERAEGDMPQVANPQRGRGGAGDEGGQ